MSEMNTVDKINAAKRELAAAETITEVKSLRDKISALHQYARASGEGRERQNDIAEAKVRAEWKGGIILRDLPRETGGRPRKNSPHTENSLTVRQSMLVEAGLSIGMADRWQTMSWLPESDLENYFITTRSKEPPNDEITSADVYRLGKKHKPHKISDPPEVDPEKYRCIVVDPPWPMERIERQEAKNQAAFDYPVMTIDDIREWQLAVEAAAPDCHLFLWTTHKFLPDALSIVTAWGFRYVCNFVWHKAGGFQPFGLPQYNCEFVVYARRGSPKFIDLKDFSTCFDGKRREHSRKPEKFYEVLKRVTDGPRIDFFNRSPIDGFDGWGNQAGTLSG